MDELERDTKDYIDKLKRMEDALNEAIFLTRQVIDAVETVAECIQETVDNISVYLGKVQVEKDAIEKTQSKETNTVS